MNPQEAVVLQQLVNGLSLGMMYALLALGFTTRFSGTDTSMNV